VKRGTFRADPENLSVLGRKVYRTGKNGQDPPGELRQGKELFGL
jgi:hypothetical protein